MRKEPKINHNRGSYNVICDFCGFKVMAHETKMTWDGFRVCLKDWDPKAPQLNPIPPIKDEQRPPKHARPDPSSDTFLDTNAWQSDSGYELDPDEIV